MSSDNVCGGDGHDPVFSVQSLIALEPPFLCTPDKTRGQLIHARLHASHSTWRYITPKLHFLQDRPPSLLRQTRLLKGLYPCRSTQAVELCKTATFLSKLVRFLGRTPGGACLAKPSLTTGQPGVGRYSITRRYWMSATPTWQCSA